MANNAKPATRSELWKSSMLPSSPNPFYKQKNKKKPKPTGQGVRALCSILDDPYSKSFVNLLRGAVFFLSTQLLPPDHNLH